MATGRTRWGLLSLVCLVVAACSLDFDRYDPGAADGGARDGSTDGVAADTAAEVTTSDAKGMDVVQDTFIDPCKATPGTLVAGNAPGPIAIDGDLGDWGAPAFTLLEASDAALIMGPAGTCTAANATSMCLVPAGETAEVALLVDAADLYVGVRVTVPTIGGANATAPYLNDAVEIYLRGDAMPNGDYAAIDHQYVIDWQNLVTDYGPPSTGATGQASPPGVTSAVRVAAGNASYVVEVKVALTELGQTTLAPGQTLGFDLGVDHGQGTVATRSFLVWWMSTHAAPKCTSSKCMGCSPDQPYCDTLDFGLVCAE